MVIFSPICYTCLFHLGSPSSETHFPSNIMKQFLKAIIKTWKGWEVYLNLYFFNMTTADSWFCWELWLAQPGHRLRVQLHQESTSGPQQFIPTLDSGFNCPERLWMPHTWRCLSPGWMWLWAIWSNTWPSGWQPCLWQRSRNLVVFGVPSNSSHSMIIWFSSSFLFKSWWMMLHRKFSYSVTVASIHRSLQK